MLPIEVKTWVQASKAGWTVGQLAASLGTTAKQVERIDQKYLRKGIVLPRLLGQREKPDSQAKAIISAIKQELRG